VAYDPSRPFFEQNKELRLLVPRAATIGRNNVDSTFVNIGAENKRGYYLVESSTSEDSAYCYWVEDHCKECLDSAFLKKTEVAYETQEARESFRVFFSNDVSQCHDSWFLKNCTNAADCFGCVNERNAKYHIFNTPYPKVEYVRERGVFDTGSYRVIEELKERFQKFVLTFPHKFADIDRSENCSGNYIANSRNCHDSYFVEDGENVRYCVRVMYHVRDIMDCDTVGFPGERCYESINTALGVVRMKFCVRCWTGTNSEYCDNCDTINDCFGCIGLRDAQYCVLNKRYTKEEYEALVPRIMSDMSTTPYVDSKKRAYGYGEFFPAELSPFAYNETIAAEYFPLSEHEALQDGYSWRVGERKKHVATLPGEQLPDHIRDVTDSITQEIISCTHNGKCAHSCSGAFRIVPQEFQFYRKIGLPLPRLCPNCRHYERQAERNPMKLWHRTCQCAGEGSSNGVYTNTATHQHGAGKCQNEFETSYSPERKEIIYCESCYNSEVV